MDDATPLNGSPNAALNTLPVIANHAGMSRPGERRLGKLQVSPVSRGPKDSVRVAPVLAAGGVTIVQGVVEPTGSMADHAGDDPLFVIIRAGAGAFTTTSADGVQAEIDCGPGDAVLVEAGAEHGFRNTGGTPLTFIAVQLDKDALGA